MPKTMNDRAAPGDDSPLAARSTRAASGPFSGPARPATMDGAAPRPRRLSVLVGGVLGRKASSANGAGEAPGRRAERPRPARYTGRHRASRTDTTPAGQPAHDRRGLPTR